MDAELIGNTRHDKKAWVSSAALNAAEIGDINLGIGGEILLAQAASLPQLENIRADNGPPVHRQTEWQQ